MMNLHLQGTLHLALEDHSQSLELPLPVTLTSEQSEKLKAKWSEKTQTLKVRVSLSGLLRGWVRCWMWLDVFWRVTELWFLVEVVWSVVWWLLLVMCLWWFLIFFGSVGRNWTVEVERNWQVCVCFGTCEFGWVVRRMHILLDYKDWSLTPENEWNILCKTINNWSLVSWILWKKTRKNDVNWFGSLVQIPALLSETMLRCRAMQTCNSKVSTDSCYKKNVLCKTWSDTQ